MTTQAPPTPDTAPAYLAIRTKMHHHVLELAIERHLKNTQAAKNTVAATGAATHDLAEVEAVCLELQRDVATQIDVFGPPARPAVEATPIEAAIADTDAQMRALAKKMLSVGALASNERAGVEFGVSPMPTRGDVVQGEYRARQIAHVFGFRVPDASPDWDEGAWRTFFDQFSGDRSAAGAWEVDFTGTDPDHYLAAWNPDLGGGMWRLVSPEFAMSDGEADAMVGAARSFVARGQKAQAAVDREIQKATTKEPSPNGAPSAPAKEKRGHAGLSAGGKTTAKERKRASSSADAYADRVAGDKPAAHAPRSAKGKRAR